MIVGAEVYYVEDRLEKDKTNYHLVMIAKNENGFIILNPGSITLPKENNPRTYGILEDHRFTIYTLDHQPFKSIEF